MQLAGFQRKVILNFAYVRETQSDLKKVQAELEATLQVKTQLKNKLKDYRQRMDNLAAVEDKRSQVSETTLSIIQSNLGTLIFFFLLRPCTEYGSGWKRAVKRTMLVTYY